MFRNNLLDIGIDPSPYGTHSFRRGGCQYFASIRRWKLRRICDWGGWSTEFSSLTIVKYLISWNDEPEESRDNFLNPEQAPSVLCPHCGRSCPCAKVGAQNSFYSFYHTFNSISCLLVYIISATNRDVSHYITPYCSFSLLIVTIPEGIFITVQLNIFTSNTYYYYEMLVPVFFLWDLVK